MNLDILHPHEKIIYKRPDLNDCLYIAQPFGKQCYAWFTESNGPCCFFVDRHTKKQTRVQVDFNKELIGTVLSGTLIYHESKQCFLLDDLFYYKHEKIVLPHLKKIELFVEMAAFHIRNHSSACIFMLPLMSHTFMDFDPIYKMYSVKIIHESAIFHLINTKKKSVFTVRPTSKSDIYELHSANTQTIAYIDTYKRSMFMNTLFELKQECVMECLWHEPFKKWIPIKPV